jgi:hypothetical protein
MTRFKTWVLTDAASNVWLDSFGVANDALRLSTPHDWSLSKHTLRGGLRDGVDLVEVHNGALSFSVLPSRGMGLWRGEYRGNFLGWRSPVAGPVHPKFVQPTDNNGLGWLAGFDELLCRCGLASNGPPGDDGGTRLTLHGRAANLPAHYVEARVGLDPPFELTVTGVVEEASLFGPQLRLTTTYTTVPGSHRLVVHDLVENRSARPAEMQMLYHVNVGPPFLEGGSRVVVPSKEVSPLTARAAEGIDTFETYVGPTVGFAEQVYACEPLADGAGKGLALLYNAAADKGFVLRWPTKPLPCFTVWKNTQAFEDGYVTGLEPATNFPNFKSFERKQGRVRVLPPGGRWEAVWGLEVYDSREGVAAVLAEVAALQAHGKRTVHRAPQPRFSAAC